MIYTVTLNPSLDYIVSVKDFKMGMTNRTETELMLPGGKGNNVSIVLKNLGVESTALGFVAGFTGEEIERRLNEFGICTDFIRLETGISRINFKLKSTEGTEVNGQGPEICEGDVESLMMRLAELKDGDVLLLAGSIPASMPSDTYSRLLEYLKEKELLVVVDAAGDLLQKVLTYRPFLIKPNHHELGALFGVELRTREEVIPYGRKLQEQGARNVLISMAGEGAVLIAENGAVYTAFAPKGEVKNGVGAGDSMVAGFLAGWMERRDYEYAFRMGVAAGSASAFSENLATGEEVRRVYESVNSIMLPRGVKMQSYRGKAVSKGIAVGKILLYQRQEIQVARHGVEDTEEELKRYRNAVLIAARQLETLRECAICDAGRTGADIFDVHKMILQDVSYSQAVEEMIRDSRVSGAYAASAVGERWAQTFAGMCDENMAARAADVRDVSARLVSILQEDLGQGDEESAEWAATGEPVIVVADDLSPSEVMELHKKQAAAFVTAKGSGLSHAAILAGMLGIPTLVRTELELSRIQDGSRGIVDSLEGIFYVEPDAETVCRAQERQSAEKAVREQLNALIGQESVSADGKKIRLCANVGNVRELKAVRENDAEGIGLFRSEFLYLEREDFPTEEEQLRIYGAAAEAMCGKRVVVRTMDIGGDKRCPYMERESGENPALGSRGIRYCLEHPEIFKTQLRALLRASVVGNMDIMYPMITGMDEVKQIKSVVAEVKEELDRQGLPYGQPKQGIMIETPAAALISDELAGEVDFFSIGTNDLTQYTLAVDRQNGKWEPHHPAVLKLIELTVKNAHEAGIPVGICGELGGDAELTKYFLEIGVDELSVSPEKILPLRKLIRQTAAEE